MKTKIAMAVMALAMVCLSLAPANAAPFDGNKDRCNDRCNGSLEKGGFGGHNGWMLLVDDATRANFDNMTLNQFKELRDEKIAELENMTVAQIEELHKKQMEKLGNMTLAQIRAMRMDRMGGMGPGMMDDGMMLRGMNRNGPLGQDGNCQGMDNVQARGGR
ncbi:MAG: hypothetical protein A4E49_03223 [Methanosaeta sp. PtaU1.Bin112]|nr:MAG: hypothetical protein A4E49_03223 [Methanosaeta sp. PtaU1.Bin112]